MNRSDLQELSQLRIREARLLLSSGYFHGAYYLSGYAVECALKACIAKQVKRFDFPDKKLATDSYSHDLERLMSISGMRPQFDTELKTNPDFALNWAVVKDWSEEARYLTTISSAQARDMYSAIVARSNGVMAWLKRRW